MFLPSPYEVFIITCLINTIKKTSSNNFFIFGIGLVFMTLSSAAKDDKNKRNFSMIFNFRAYPLLTYYLTTMENKCCLIA